MISLARIHLVLFSICTVALGTEPNDTGVQLTFQISPIPLAVPHPLQAKPQDRKPSYAAGITAQGPTDFFPGPRSNRVDDFLSFAQKQGLSLPQKEFLEDTNGLLDSTERSVTFYYPIDDPNHPQVLLYAMSLADAKRMAELYLQFARRDFNELRDQAERTIQDKSEQAAKAEKRIPELEKSLEAMQKSFEQAKSVVPYRSEQEALEAIGELGRMLNTAQVEISGIRAKIEAIQGYQEPHQGDAILSPKLEIMFIEEAVAMRGAAARKQTATELRTQASQFIDLKQAIKYATEQKDELTRDLPVWREILPSRREDLAAMRDKEPKIRDNKVVIYPVR